jgi:hypothetical protein
VHDACGTRTRRCVVGFRMWLQGLGFDRGKGDGFEFLVWVKTESMPCWGVRRTIMVAPSVVLKRRSCTVQESFLDYGYHQTSTVCACVRDRRGSWHGLLCVVFVCMSGGVLRPACGNTNNTAAHLCSAVSRPQGTVQDGARGAWPCYAASLSVAEHVSRWASQELSTIVYWRRSTCLRR